MDTFMAEFASHCVSTNGQEKRRERGAKAEPPSSRDCWASCRREELRRKGGTGLEASDLGAAVRGVEKKSMRRKAAVAAAQKAT